jgi:adenylate cyclase
VHGVHLAGFGPVVALVLATAIGMGRGAWLDNKERAELMMIFSRHVSTEVADALWERRDKLISRGTIVPRTVDATVFFVDVRGFTSVFEKLPPEAAVPWLNQGLAAMTDEIMQRRGVVARFIGDSIMAVFGSPLARDSEAERAQDADNAISAALAIGSALDRLNAEFSAQGLPRFRVRIGINSGKMTQCSVGTFRRMEFTVLGDPVNTAFRLESFVMEDDGGTIRILIGEETMRLAGERFVTRTVGAMTLKGKEQPVTITQVTGRK